MAVRFEGYWSGTFEEYKAGRVEFQQEMPDDAAEKWMKIVTKGYEPIEQIEKAG